MSPHSVTERARCPEGIGLIFFDLDGTVYRDFSTISGRTFAAFDAVKARGTVLVAASWRSLRFMPPPLEAWGGLDYFIGANGVCTYDVRTGECLHEGAIPPDAALEIMRITDDLDAAWLAFYDDIVMREEKSHYYLALEMRRTGIPDREHQGSIHKLAATFPSVAATEEAFIRLKGLPIVEAAHTAGVEIEVSAAGFTKGSSSAWLARRLGIPRERTIAFGDAGNDVSFAGNVGKLIAVGDRSPALVAVADEVAPPIEEDGVATWIESHIDLFGAEL